MNSFEIRCELDCIDIPEGDRKATTLEAGHLVLALFAVEPPDLELRPIVLNCHGRETPVLYDFRHGFTPPFC